MCKCVHLTDLHWEKCKSKSRDRHNDRQEQVEDKESEAERNGNLNCTLPWSIKSLCKVGLPGSCAPSLTSSSWKHLTIEIIWEEYLHFSFMSSICLSGAVNQWNVWINEMEWETSQTKTWSHFAKLDSDLQTETCDYW